ncbi:MAG TPA: hypothetical protein VMW75_27145 [Thermoanaerobaculia bacterium]|nr:hypothetical protein [Thermoanaerobaculia bacterium]
MSRLPHEVFPWATATPIAALLVGIALLLFGRRLFWLFVAVIGFMAGWYLAMGGGRHGATGGGLLVALVAGLIGLVLALVVQKVAVALAGFFVGAYLLAGLLGWQLPPLRPGQQLVLLAAGVVAAVLALALFDLALILYSAIAGAGLILENVHLHLGGNARLLALVVLAAVGAAFQARWLQRPVLRR